MSTHIRILKLQSAWCLSESPLKSWPIKRQPNGKDYIVDLLCSIHELGLSFEVDPNFVNRIEGGTIAISSILDIKSIKNALTSLKFNHILYLDQVTSLDGLMLLKWIDTRLYEQTTVGKAPKWFSILEDLVLQSPLTSRRLKPEFTTPYKTPGDYSPLELRIKARPREWVAVWTNQIQNVTYGQICKSMNNNQDLMISHWDTDFSAIQSSPSHQPLTLKKCQGCTLNDPSIDIITKYSKNPRPPCVFTCRHDDALNIPTTNKKKTDTNIIFSFSTFSLKQIVKFHFMKNNPIANTNFVSYPETISTSKFNPITSFVSPFAYIEKYIKSPIFKRELTKIANKFDRYSHLSFYTDGSVKRDITNTNTKAAAAWIETSTVMATEFSCGINCTFISSTKAEIMAIISALLVAPRSSTVDIYTDSQNVIFTYEQIKNTNVLIYPRECFKTTHVDLWYIIFDLLYNNELSITFHKVKAHAGNIYNNQVDLLAKDALDCEPMEINIINTGYNVAPKFMNTVITTHVRKFVKALTVMEGFFEFYNLRRNAKYKHLDIDWISTFDYLNADSLTNSTTFSASNLKSRRVKLMMEELPTIEYLKHCKPSIYGDWTCICCDEEETFNHLWTCPYTQPILESIIEFSQEMLFRLLKIAQPQLEHDHPAVARLINNPDIWNPTTSLNSYTFVDLIKGFVASSLSRDIQEIVSTKSLTSSILITLLQAIFDKVQQDIWMPRCDRVVQKEKRHNITQKQKIFSKDKYTAFLKRSYHVPEVLIAAPPRDVNLQNIFSLAQVSIINGLHHNSFLGGSGLHTCCH